MTQQQAHEISTPLLTAAARSVLVTAIAAVEAGVKVEIALTYKKQTDAKRRIANEDYVAYPGVSFEAHKGILQVKRYVSNRANQRSGRAGKIYLQVKDEFRSDQWTRIRPEGLTAVVVELPRQQTPAPQPQQQASS